MTPLTPRQVWNEILDLLPRAIDVHLPVGVDPDTRAGKLAFLAALKTRNAANRRAAARAEARRREESPAGDPLREAYLVGGGAAFVETADEDGGVHVDDSDDAWEDYDPEPALDKFLPRRKQDAADAKSGDGPKASDGNRSGTPLARLMRTDADGTGRPDHEPAERKPTSALSRFLERRRK